MDMSLEVTCNWQPIGSGTISNATTLNVVAKQQQSDENNITILEQSRAVVDNETHPSSLDAPTKKNVGATLFSSSNSETAGSSEPCLISFSPGGGPLVCSSWTVLEVTVDSEARTVELYAADGEYAGTHRGEKVRVMS